MRKCSAILLGLLVLMVTPLVQAGDLKHFTGQMYTYKGHLYVAQDPKYPKAAYEVQWKAGHQPKSICHWNISHFCQPVTIYYDRLTPKSGGGGILQNASIGTPWSAFASAGK